MHVLVPFDGSERAEAALERAVERHPDARVTVLSVVDPLSERGRALSDGPLDVEGDVVMADGGQLAAVGRVTRERNADVTPAVEVGSPAETIVEYAEEYDVDAVVMGSRERSGVARLLFGSVAETVARHAPVDVTLVH